MQESKYVPVYQAARELGMNPQCVRERIKRKMFHPEIGYAMPSLTGEHVRYFIYRDKLDRFLGKE